MDHFENETADVQQTPVQNNPVPRPAPKKKRWIGKVLLGALAVILAVMLVVSSSGATALLLGVWFDGRMDTMQADFQRQLEQVQKSAGSVTGNSGLTVETTPGSLDTPVAEGSLMTPAQVYQKNLSSVVLVESTISGGYYSGGSTGTGFIISQDGYVVTNYHVVEGGSALSIVTVDGNSYDAELIGYDNANDIALLKVDATGLQAVTIGDSDSLIVGDQVAAIGNPLGELTSTMTVGYVSAKERDVNTSGFAINMIQTDAAINSGNSGGPLFNMYGQVIGITTAKYSGSSSSGATIEGIGFAIPINDVLPLLEDLMENGYYTGPYLGVSVSDMDPEAAEYYNMPLGAYVSEVVPGACADKAGIEAKDIITKVGQYSVDSVNELSQALRRYKAGDTIQIVLYRSGRELTIEVTLDQKPQEEELPVSEAVEPTQGQSGEDDWMDGWFPGWG